MAEADEHPVSMLGGDATEAAVAAELAELESDDAGSSPASPEGTVPGIAELLGAEQDSCGDPFAGSDATEVNADELLRWQRRRSATGTASLVDTGGDGTTSPAKRRRSSDQ